MKSYRRVFDRIVSLENLVAAFVETRRGKRKQPALIRFEESLEENLYDLHLRLSSDSWEPLPYSLFEILDPKLRLICAPQVPDRVVHRGIGLQIDPILDRTYIADTYACRPGKGPHRARARCQEFARRFPFCLSCDVVKYFPSIDHQLLLARFEKRFPEKSFMRLVERILRSFTSVPGVAGPHAPFPGDAPADAARPRGLVLGSHLSQIAGNLYLSDLDHAIKERRRVAGYLRYADDLLLFARTQEEARDHASWLRAELAALRLRLHGAKTHVIPVAEGIPFLGFRIFRDQMMLLRSNVRRFNRRLRDLKERFRAGEVDPAEIGRSLRSWIAHARSGRTDRLVSRLWKKVVFSK